jgi:putative transposase
MTENSSSQIDTFLLEQQPVLLEFLQKQSEDGVITEMSNLSLHQKDNVELTCLLNKLQLKNAISENQFKYLKKMCVIVEYLLQNKKTILKDKSLIWLTNSPDFQYIKMSGQVLTSRGDHFYYFWNKHRKDLYDLLPLPQKIDYVDLRSNLLNGYSSEITLKSWFSTKKIPHQKKNLQEISLPSCKFLTVDGMEKGDIKLSKITKNPMVMKCRKYKLKVPKEAKLIFNKWKGLYNFVYNRSTWMFNESTEVMLDTPLRNCMKSANQWGYYPFIDKLPTELREGASNEFSKNATAAFTNKRNGNIKSFHMGYRKKSSKYTLTNFQKRSIKFAEDINGNINRKQFRLLPSYCPFVLQSFKELPEINNDFSLHYDGSDFYLLLPFEGEVSPRIDTGNVIALDPGVRTFQTTFSNTGDSLEFCTSDSVARLHSLAINLDRLISKRSTCNNSKDRKRKILSNQITKIRKKLKNLQVEMHYKISNKLTKENDIIILPSFETSGMSRKAKRKLRTKTVRKMSLLAHSSFKELLKTKAIERGCRILICEEHYTSKTCSTCGLINKKLGSSKKFTCSDCNVTVDRDINAARNIMLRAMRGSAISDIEINKTFDFKEKLKGFFKSLLSFF